MASYPLTHECFSECFGWGPDDVTLMIPGGVRPMDSPDFCWALSWHRSSLPGSFTVVENVGLGGALTQGPGPPAWSWLVTQDLQWSLFGHLLLPLSKAGEWPQLPVFNGLCWGHPAALAG